MTLDFHTADNAIPPHVNVFYVETERTICMAPIDNGDVAAAEMFAEFIVDAFKGVSVHRFSRMPT